MWFRHDLVLLLLTCSSLLVGCSPSGTTGQPDPDNRLDGPPLGFSEANTSDEPVEPAEVELSEPRGRIDKNGIFWFEVDYRFVKGQPKMHYKLTVHFPGTRNLCIKTMEAWELKGSGTIKDGIPLIEQPIASYEFEFSEADSPMNAYHRISNLLSGSMAVAKREVEGAANSQSGQDTTDDVPSGAAQTTDEQPRAEAR